jgi:hypothetical protein
MTIADFDGDFVYQARADQLSTFDDFESDFEVEYAQGLPRQPTTEDKPPHSIE